MPCGIDVSSRSKRGVRKSYPTIVGYRPNTDRSLVQDLYTFVKLESDVNNGTNDNRLREEIAELGELLGGVVEHLSGSDSLQLVESTRRLSRDFRQQLTDHQENLRLRDLLASLDCDQLRTIIRAFTVFLDLANLAEDRQRVRILRQRKREATAPGGKKVGESIDSAIDELQQRNVSASQVQKLLDKVNLELVFTAHPTEAKRKSIRKKLRTIRELLTRRDDISGSSEARRSLTNKISAEIAKLWLTDFIRPWRPSVMQEVQRGLSFKPTLWRTIPELTAELRAAVASAWPRDTFQVKPCIRFGSWIGGDRDGHPFVTATVTRQTATWLRSAAVEFHLETCRSLGETLSISTRQVGALSGLERQIEEAILDNAALRAKVEEIPPNEAIRQWLAVIAWRLEHTPCELDSEAIPDHGYRTRAGLADDVQLVRDAMMNLPGGVELAKDVTDWLDQIQAFGLQMARLDIRQDSKTYRTVIDELLEKSGVAEGASLLDEPSRQIVLSETLGKSIDFTNCNLSDEANETLELFRLQHRIVDRFGREALGNHIVSMTHVPSDLLGVLWLWHHAVDQHDAPDTVRRSLPIPIVPLFETIEDLNNAADILRDLLRLPRYRALLEQHQNLQVVMLGYSDSTKDGGYLSACWALYESQIRLQEIAANEGVELKFFHGRGGSLGRGGGPAARSILSLPRSAFHGALRITEQGEVLADRYDDPKIARRHWEQLIWASLLAAGTKGEQVAADWAEVMNGAARHSFDAYRQLVEHASFVEFFRTATPISEIEQLPIGSRPSRRKKSNALKDLRAIPWVFSWTQARFLLPAWYGVGSAFNDLVDDTQTLKMLRTMYQEWSFFQATIDNAELALAKVDLGIAKQYAELLTTDASDELMRLITEEFHRAKRVVLDVRGHDELLQATPWLKQSISVRNWYTDPLNFIQIELLRRMQASEHHPLDDAAYEELRHLTRLTVNGIATGLRTTG